MRTGGFIMALDVHGTATSVVAHQHLAAGARRSDDGAAANTDAVRTVAQNADGHDTVDVSTHREPAAAAATLSDAGHALGAAQHVSVQITINPSASLDAQAHSAANRVFELVR